MLPTAEQEGHRTKNLTAIPEVLLWINDLTWIPGLPLQRYS